MNISVSELEGSAAWYDFDPGSAKMMRLWFTNTLLAKRVLNIYEKIGIKMVNIDFTSVLLNTLFSHIEIKCS
jgi:hypothetical protein